MCRTCTLLVKKTNVIWYHVFTHWWHGHWRDIWCGCWGNVASFRSCVPLVICSILELGHYDGPSYSPLYFHSDWNPIAQPIIQAKEKFIPFIRIVNSAHKIYKIYHPIYQNCISNMVPNSPELIPQYKNSIQSLT